MNTAALPTARSGADAADVTRRFEFNAQLMIVEAEALHSGHRECQLVGEFAVGQPQPCVLFGELF
ncbi:hypothetical protein [Amycolatopsis sp. CA-128772]|uniref:hypothetical protein n=1 Tax=Amycolatopsis sp. CA-128772 TaxID=2073159 RepID=UPI001304C97F|nr:hypothetical protein [Amycolatopsis sp. CA-128772]